MYVYIYIYVCIYVYTHVCVSWNHVRSLYRHKASQSITICVARCFARPSPDHIAPGHHPIFIHLGQGQLCWRHQIHEDLAIDPAGGRGETSR